MKIFDAYTKDNRFVIIMKYQVKLSVLENTVFPIQTVFESALPDMKAPKEKRQRNRRRNIYRIDKKHLNSQKEIAGMAKRSQ